AAEKVGRENLSRSWLAQARASRWSRRAGHVTALRNAAALSPSQELRDEAVASMALADLTEKRRLVVGAGAFTAFDADLERYAVCDQRGRITVRTLADDRETARMPGS